MSEEKYSFENFIMQCCKAQEGDLRKFLKKMLTKYGFTIKEDDYSSYRSDEKYRNVHNLLAIRGEQPRICLVAHTDVCRDHEFSYREPKQVDPIMKIVEINDEVKIIIQDRNCETQVGGDDRLGVAINTWIALNSGYDMGLLFTTDEEVGLESASRVRFPELLDFDVLVQVDRGNHSHQLVTEISGTKLCSDTTSKRLLKIAEDIGLPRYAVNGFLTDVLAIKSNGMCRNAVNMTCGYHNSIGSDSDEYIDIDEARDTMKYVANIIKYYYLEEDKNEDENSEQQYAEFENDNEETIMVARPNRCRTSRSGKHRGKKASGKGESEDLFSEKSYDRDRSYFEDSGSGWNNFMG